MASLLASSSSSSCTSSSKLPIISFNINAKVSPSPSPSPSPSRRLLNFRISAQQQEADQAQESQIKAENEQMNQQQQQEKEKEKEEQTVLRPVEPQVNVRSRNLSREYGGQWLSSVTRHVRIYAAYIDPETCEMDQTQMDKLTLILDPTDEFVWNDETCNKKPNSENKHRVYQIRRAESSDNRSVNLKQGAPLTEYTLRLIGSDVEHYIRKLLYDGEIKYNMNSRVLNFSMGKPRMKFNSSELQDVQ